MSQSQDVVICTEHQSSVDWLKAHGIQGQVFDPSQAQAGDISNKDVIATDDLPMHLALMAKTVTLIETPNAPSTNFQSSWSPSQLDQYGARLRTYQLRPTSTPSFMSSFNKAA